MPVETEAKSPLTDPGMVRQRLQQLGATPLGRVLQTDHILDSADHGLLLADCGLRVREVREAGASTPGASGAGVLTFKGPRTGAALKSREEIETEVSDAPALLAVLRRLGFHDAIVYEKRRETWRLGPCSVALDELPELGWWVEIEGPDGQAIEAARLALGLAEVPVVRQTYVEMAAARGRLDEQGIRRLTFADR